MHAQEEKKMAGRQRKFTPPPGFTQCPKLRAKYEEYGVKLGRLYLWYPDRAIKAWSFLGGVIGPRWLLEVFRYHCIKDNPTDYKRWKKVRELARLREERRNA